MTRIKVIYAVYAIFLVALAVILLAGCSSSSSTTSSVPRYQSQYPASVRSAYLNSCQGAGASAGACGCSLNWWMDHISYAKFNTFGYDVEMNIPSAELSGDLAIVTKACKL